MCTNDLRLSGMYKLCLVWTRPFCAGDWPVSSLVKIYTMVKLQLIFTESYGKLWSFVVS